MRFEYEKLSVRSLTRRVAEHEEKTGKVVTRVVLTHSEWREFINEAAPKLYHETRPEYASFRCQKPHVISHTPFNRIYHPFEVTTFDVVPERG
jgi:hypothetical protein